MAAEPLSRYVWSLGKSLSPKLLPHNRIPVATASSIAGNPIPYCQAATSLDFERLPSKVELKQLPSWTLPAAHHILTPSVMSGSTKGRICMMG